MNLTRRVFTGMLFVAAFAWSSAAFAQTKDEKKPAGDKPAAKAADAKTAAPATDKKPIAGDKAAGMPSPEEMAKMMPLVTPGEFHAKLKPLVGKWTFITKWRMTPEAPWTESDGKAEYRWINGGRFLVHEVKGNPGTNDAMMGGAPFEGFGITGYDNIDKKYHNTWTDNWGTGMMIGTGTVDGSGKSFTYNNDYNCPMTGGARTSKTILKIAGDDKLVFEMYDKAPDGKEFINVEVTYTRVK